MPINDEPYKARRLNLLKYRNREFHGSSAKLAEKLNLSKPALAKYLSKGSSVRVIRDTKARLFEKKLGLPEFSLDHVESRQTHIYYVVITVQSRHVLNVLKWLQRFPEIQEASGTYGSFDIIAKLEVDEPKFLGIVVGEIGGYPGVIRTETHPCVNDLHWQRAQKVNMKRELGIQEINTSVDSYADEYIKVRMQAYFSRIESLNQGEAIANDRHAFDIDRVKMIRSARKSIFAVRLKDDVTQSDREYWQAEKRAIEAGANAQRLVVVEDDYCQRFEEIREMHQNLASINSHTRYVLQKNWVISEGVFEPLDFLIVDRSFVYIREPSHSRINKNPEKVKQYYEAFMHNWRQTSMDFAELEKHYLNDCKELPF